MARFATIGHSNRPREAVLGMLQEAGISLLVDVRSFPKSRTNPDYNDDVFPPVLAERQIGYCHMLALGGRRPRQPGVDEATNAFWRVRSFQNYADYALGPEFRDALRQLVELGTARPAAIMCSEAVWWRCHRRIITDYLLLGGHGVRHLIGARPRGRGAADRSGADARRRLCRLSSGKHLRTPLSARVGPPGHMP